MSMEQNGNQNMSAPTFCRNGCGFYAAQAFDGMCSKCYKDLKELQQSSQPAVPSSSPSPTAGRVATLVGGDSNKKSDVDSVASSLSRTSLGEMNLNSSSNSGNNDKLLEKLGGSGSNGGGAVGGGGSPSTSEVETGSPTVATTTAKASGEDTGEGTSADGEAGSDGEKGKKSKKNRCMECRKRVGLTGFQCHCGKLFCSLHRYSDTHDCTFDFKEQGQQEIRKNNPVVKAEKVQKI